MNTKNLALVAGALGSLFLCLNSGLSPEKASAQLSLAPSSTSLVARVLMGSVHSANGKPMEGVAVSGRDIDQTFTTTVYTDEKGNYFFPSLGGGRYRVWAQAVGYEPARAEMTLDPSREKRQDFTLKTVEDFSPQLSGTEWLSACRPIRRRIAG